MNVLPILYGVGFILIVLGLICVIVWKLKQKYKLNVPLAIWNGIAMLPILFSPLVFLGSVFQFVLKESCQERQRQKDTS